MEIKILPSTASMGLVLGCVIFGLGSIIVARLGLGAYALAFWRLVVAGAIFWALLKILGRKMPKNKKAIFFALFSGVFLALDLAFWHESIYAVGPGIATLLNSLQIFWLSFVGFFCLGQKQSKMQIFSIFLAIFGVFLIAMREFSLNLNANMGFIYGILSGLALALSMIFIRVTHKHEKTDIFALMFLLSVGGAATLVVPSLADSGRFLPQNASEISLILVYGALMQCLAWGLIAFCVPFLSLGATGLLLLSEPVATLIIDSLLLGKDYSLTQYLGAFITMVAIYLGSKKT